MAKKRRYDPQKKAAKQEAKEEQRKKSISYEPQKSADIQVKKVSEDILENQQAENKNSEEKKFNTKIFVIVLIVAVLVIAVIIAAVFTGKKQTGSETTEPDSAEVETESSIKTDSQEASSVDVDSMEVYTGEFVTEDFSVPWNKSDAEKYVRFNSEYDSTKVSEEEETEADEFYSSGILVRKDVKDKNGNIVKSQFYSEDKLKYAIEHNTAENTVNIWVYNDNSIDYYSFIYNNKNRLISAIHEIMDSNQTVQDIHGYQYNSKGELVDYQDMDSLSSAVMQAISQKLGGSIQEEFASSFYDVLGQVVSGAGEAVQKAQQ